MRSFVFGLLVLLAGCDATLGPIDGSTDPEALALGDPWIAVEAVVEGDRVSFPADGYTLTVRGGILGGRTEPNSYGAQQFAALGDGSIQIEEIITTLVGGTPEQERRGAALTTALANADRFEVTDRELALYGPDGDGIRFRR
ncbi:MAG: hypothetical protein AAGK21_05665 [Bacteroidota bacterium]